MTVDCAWIKLEPESALHTLRGAVGRVKAGDTGVGLDFETLPRIDPAIVDALEQLAALSRLSSVQVTLRGVNVSVYKVLKLLRLSRDFTFVS